jgi:hypothetical protein
MSPLQKAVVLGLGVAMATTLVLPGRQTPAVLGAGSKLITGTISTEMGTSQGAVGG